MAGKVLIFGKDRPGDPKRDTWSVVSGFPGEDEARAYAAVIGGGAESGAIKTSADELQRGDILIPDSIDFKDYLKREGLEKEFKAAVKKIQDDRAEAERLEQERREQLAAMRAEAERRKRVEERTQQLRDEQLRAELEEFEKRAAAEVDKELATS